MAQKRNAGRVQIDPNFKQTCFLCSRDFQFGMHVYDGKQVAAWGIMLCSTCVAANWDGVVLDSYNGKLRKHLEQKGIEIRLNQKGWLPIPM